MRRLIIYIAIAGIAAGTISCNKDFLNRYPQTSIAPSLFFRTEQDLSLYINGLLTLPGCGQFLADQSSDNMATTGAIEVKVVMTGTPTAENITSGWSWSRLRNVNYFLDNCGTAQVDSSVLNHYIGLARYYRAMFYFSMVQRYSDVPWYSHTLTPEDTSLTKPRDPRALVMDSVMADLDFAATHVNVSVPQGTPGQWAVKLFYARVALYEGTYRKYHSELSLAGTAAGFIQTAANVSKDIMTNGGFSIYNTGNPSQDHATLFNSQDLTKNPEVILPYVYDVSLGVNGAQNGYMFGNYEQSPSRDLVETYLMQDGTRFTDQPGYNTFGFVQEFQGRDPRLSQTIAYPGWIEAPNTVPYVQILSNGFTGYHQLKGYINSTDPNILGGADFPSYRYAEALLIYAEAQAELGVVTQNDLDISVNLLRARAGLPGMTLVQANGNPDPVLASAYPAVSGSDKGALLEIRRERRVELAMEGFRYDDLMRWDAGKLLTNIPQGMYFPGPGKYDLTGDGVPDVCLIDDSQAIPNPADTNSLGVSLIYYKVGMFSDGTTVIPLVNGTSGGATVTDVALRNFIDPKYYYRPVPETEVILNPNLVQIFGW